MDEIDRLGRHGASVLTAEVHRRMDPVEAERVLRQVRSAEPDAVVVLPTPLPRRRSWIAVAAAAAAVVLVAAGTVMVLRRDDSHRLRPTVPSTVVVPTVVVLPTSTVPTPSTSAAPTATTVVPVDRAVVALDGSTPEIGGTIVASTPIANDHPWQAAVTPSGRVFLGQTVDGATYSEVVDGQLVDTGIPFEGELAAGLDGRLYTRSSVTAELDAWAQDAAGTWVVADHVSTADDCQVVVQPDAVQCGPGVLPVEPVASGSYVEWLDGMQVRVRTADRTSEWQIELDSADIGLDACSTTDCHAGWRAGDAGFAWTPALGLDLEPTSRLVSLLQPDTSPATAWLRCGGDCQVVGATPSSLYTLGHAEAGDGEPGIVVRRFDFDDIAALRSAPVEVTDLLARFPAPPASTPALDDVPMLLPSPMPAGVTATRMEGAQDAPSTVTQFVQTFVATGDPGKQIEIATNVGGISPTAGEQFDAPGWDRAFYVSGGGAFGGVTLKSLSGYVQLWGAGLSRDEWIDVARSMRRGAGAAWSVDVPPGFVAVSQGWSTFAASRTVHWLAPDGSLIGELSIVWGAPTLASQPFSSPVAISEIDIGDVPAFAYLWPALVAVTWSPQPDVTVRFGWNGDDAMAIAQSIVPVDRATWEAETVVDTNDDDGCYSLFC